MAFSLSNSGNSSSNDIELLSLKSGSNSPKDGNNNKKKQERTVNFSSDIDLNGNKVPKKNVQFSQLSIESDTEAKPNLVPNRKREEETVMENLRKKVGESALDKNFRRKVSNQDHDGVHQMNEKSTADDENSIYKPAAQKTDDDFILDCLCWHNEYRARHGVSSLTVASKLCEHAQLWANHLANLNELYYSGKHNFGQNIFCCPETSLLVDLSGQEVATYWYSSVKRYNFFKDPRLLHTQVNAGLFTQIVWKATKYFGVAKAISNTGKIFVVALYFPPGNITGEFQENVPPPIVDPTLEATSNSENSNK